jgi:hypothetical protein
MSDGPYKMYAYRSAPIFFNYLPFDDVALSFMRLTQYFQKISHHIQYITFRFKFMVLFIVNIYIKICIYFRPL